MQAGKRGKCTKIFFLTIRSFFVRIAPAIQLSKRTGARSEEGVIRIWFTVMEGPPRSAVTVSNGLTAPTTAQEAF